MSDSKLEVVLSGDNAALVAALEAAENKIKQFAKKGKDDVDELGNVFDRLSAKNIAQAVIGFTTLAGAANMALDLIFTQIKAIIDIIPEAIAGTGELTKAYRTLAITAGLSVVEFNQWLAVVRLAGGSTDDLNSLVQGMERGIKRHSEALIANGVFTSENALKQATLAEYIQAVVTKAISYGDATSRDLLLMDSFGRTGMEFAGILVAINTRMKEGMDLGDNESIITKQAIADQKELGYIKNKIAYEEMRNKALISNATIEYDIMLKKSALDYKRYTNDMLEAQSLAKAGLIEYQTMSEESTGNVVADYEKMIAAAKEYNKVTATIETLNKQGANFAAREKAKADGTAKEEYDPKAAEKDAADKKRREQEAKESQEAINRLKEQGFSLDLQILHVQEHSTIQEKEELAIADAKEKLRKTNKGIDGDVEKAHGNPEAISVANENRRKAQKEYEDTLTKIAADGQKERDRILDDLWAKEVVSFNRVEDEKLQGKIKGLDSQAKLEVESVTFLESIGKINSDEALAKIHVINELKYQAEKTAIDERIALRRAEGNVDLAAIARLETEKAKIEDKHNEDLRKSNQALYLEMRKHNPMLGLRDGAKDYVKAAEDHFTQFKGYVTSILNGAEQSVQSALKGMITGQMTFGEAMKSIWTGIAGAVLDALTNIIAKYIVAAAAQAIFATSSETVANTQAAAALDTAVAESFAAYAAIPFYGFALGAAQAALIEESFLAAKLTNANLTAFATGGMADKPTYGIFGEKGPELLAPKEDFMTVTKALVAGGAAMYSNIVKSQARVDKYATSSPITSNSNVINNSNRSSNGHTINVHGYVGNERQLAKELNRILNNDTRIYGS